jgi:hypothetical protein
VSEAFTAITEIHGDDGGKWLQTSGLDGPLHITVPRPGSWSDYVDLTVYPRDGVGSAISLYLKPDDAEDFARLLDLNTATPEYEHPFPDRPEIRRVIRHRDTVDVDGERGGITINRVGGRDTPEVSVALGRDGDFMQCRFRVIFADAKALAGMLRWAVAQLEKRASE